ncbi:S41 family peptidase [Staphylococcus sp. 11261D007BR]
MKERRTSKTKHTQYVKLNHLVISILITFILTALVTSSIFFLYTSNHKKDEVDNNADKLSNIYQLIANDYYQNQDKDDLMEKAVKGMTDSLNDPYTEYLSKDETEAFNEDMSGDFVGIGAEMEQKDEGIFISTPLKDSPAEKVGLKSNDQVLKIDNQSIKDKKLSDIIPKIRGKKGTTVSLTIKRNDAVQTYDIKRDTIHVESVEHQKVDDIDVFKINKFQEGTAGELKMGIQKAQKQGANQILLDLRNNPGGLLDEAVKMANIFMEKDEVVVQLEKGDKTEKVRTSNEPLKNIDQLDVSILINDGSASASEVFTGALKDSGIAKVYGETSFGKGIVQTTHSFSDGSLLKFTEMKWLTPKHQDIHKKGIKPDVKTEGASYENIKPIPQDKTLQEGDKNKSVQSIKIGLRALGYDISTTNTSYDQNLANAVSEFQKDHKLTSNGQFDAKTNQTFTEQLIKKSSKEDPMLRQTIQKINDAS